MISLEFCVTLFGILAFCQAFDHKICKHPISNIDKIERWLDVTSQRAESIHVEISLAEWDWATNITSANNDRKTKLRVSSGEVYKRLWREAKCFDCEAAKCSEKTSRRIKAYIDIGSSALPAEKYKDYLAVDSVLENLYSTAKVCNSLECMALEPDLTELLKTSEDYCEQQWAWEGWRNATGQPMRSSFLKYLHYQHQVAKLNGYDNAKKMWTSDYIDDEPKFFEQIEQAWSDIKPLYQELHTYVRTKLTEQYGSNYFPSSGHLPAHLLGNMWSQEWTKLYELVVPYPNAPSLNLTKQMTDQGWNVSRMFHESDHFFQSIGLAPMTETFWKKSIFIRQDPPTEMVCHASAWDMGAKDDFRIKMCSVVDANYFQTVHHEMGHIQYDMQYRHQPYEFQGGANPGFHEAIGDLIALSVMTPAHFKAVGLLPKDFEESKDKLPFMPFGYLVDKYRWSLFDGSADVSQLNAEWWKLRCSIQGISPPVARSEIDFDPGSKYHIAGSVPYIRYFFSMIAQFQFHRSICKNMGITEDFHLCDFYGNVNATAQLREVLALGSSQPWPETMEKMTGTRKLDSTAMVDYFKPLLDWLRKQNEGAEKGWSDACPEPKQIQCKYQVSSAPSAKSSEWVSCGLLLILSLMFN